MNKKFFFAVVIAAVSFGLAANRIVKNPNNLSAIELANVESLASGEIPAGTCYGAGPGFTNIVCPGGEAICCWAHTSIYGEN